MWGWLKTVEVSRWESKIELRRHILMGKKWSHKTYIRHGPERKGHIVNILDDNFFEQICLILCIYICRCMKEVFIEVILALNIHELCQF